MRFKRVFCTGGICVFFIVLGSLLAGGDVWGQDSLKINYTSLSMGGGTSQNLSASGGCPPYNWNQFRGGGALTPGGGGNTSASYVAPASNPNCGNNATITLADRCRNTAEIQVAVNSYTPLDKAFQEADLIKCRCFKLQNGDCVGYAYETRYIIHIRAWACNNSVLTDCNWGPDDCSYFTSPPPCGNFCPCDESDDAGCWPTNCAVLFSTCAIPPPAPCDTLVDLRTTDMKNQGCCPLNPSTGLPLSGAIPDIEERGKNAGKICEGSEGNPTNAATGNKYEETLDLSISTPGIPLEFRRSYNSQIIIDGPLGYGWTHRYDLSLGVVQTSPTKRVRIWDSDGRGLYFSQVQQTSTEILFGGESGVKDRLKQIISTGEYFLRRKQGNLTYRFGPDGKILAISDPNGNSLAFTYTGGFLTQVTNNFGKSLSIQYNTENRISSITDPKGQLTLYEYTNGDLTKVTYPDQNFVSYAYSNHNLTDKYDTNNNLTGHWAYDDRHRVTTYYSHLKDGVPQQRIDLTYQPGGTVVTKSTGATTYNSDNIDKINVVKEKEGCSSCGTQHKRLEYNSRVDVVSVTNMINDTGGITTQYVYDNPPNPSDYLGEIQQKTEAVGLPEQRTTFYTYTHRTDDPFLLTQSTETIKSVVDPLQNKVITIAYDNQGNILSRQESGYVFINGVATQKTYTTTYQYNAVGQLTQIDGPRTDVSDITTYEYYENTSGQGNNRGQLKAIVNALGQRTEFSDYDANGNVGTITDPNGVVTQRTYDERNRIKTITNLSTSAQTQYSYDSRGNLITVIMPEGNTINSTYDLANRLTDVTDTLGNLIHYEYDVEGNRIHEETKDPQGTLKKYLDFTYDAYSRLRRIVNPDTNYTEYTYDALGDRTNVKDPRNNNTTYAYDNLRRMITMTQPAQSVTQYGHDTQDNQTSIIDPKGNTTQYFYDDFGRKNQTGSPDTGITDYLYDETGNLIQKVDAKETVVNYTYDALNRLTAIQFPSDPNQNVTFTFDSPLVSYGIGKLTGRTDPSGSYTFYYDAQGNLTKEEKTINNILYTTEYTYNKDNNLTSITYPYILNQTGRPVTYTLDQTGRITQVTTTLNESPKALASSITYLPYGGITGLTYGNGLSLRKGYDNQYRISSIITGSVQSMAYGYDANGNITWVVDTINPPGGEIIESPGTYTYQQGTNKLTHIEGTPPIDYGYDADGNITSETGWTYVYDLSNQLIRVLQNSNQVAEYTYNGAGQRIKKVTQTEARIFHYDLWGHLIAETNQNGQMLAEYIYLRDQLLAVIKPGDAVYYYHNDHLGTPQVLTDDSQTIAWKAAYTPFGEAVASIQTVENPFRFPGQYYDQETGLHYNYFRYYDPTTGRYVTPDPIALEGGINLFPYASGNPLRWVDPFGLQSSLQIGPPPVPVPRGGPDNGWKWNPDPRNSRGGTWGPQKPIPGQSQPSASWEDPEPGGEGHWDVDDGLGNRQRYDKKGRPITEKQAHDMQEKQSGDPCKFSIPEIPELTPPQQWTLTMILLLIATIIVLSPVGF